MEWFAFLFLGLFAEGIVTCECDSTQDADGRDADVSLTQLPFHESQIMWIGQTLIDAIEGDYAKLEKSMKQTNKKSAGSYGVNKDLNKINERLATFLELKPGTQKVKSKLKDLPPKTEYETGSKNLTTSQAFLHYAETLDEEWIYLT